MSKRLEEEYRQMVENEVPDLWSRIESGLREKTPVSSNEPVVETKQNIQPAAQAGQNIPPVVGTAQNTKTKKKKPVIVKLIPWMGVATAAAIIAIIVIPSVLKTTKHANKTMSMEMMDYSINEIAGAPMGDGATKDAGEDVAEEAMPAQDEPEEEPVAQGENSYKVAPESKADGGTESVEAEAEVDLFYVWIREIKIAETDDCGLALCEVYRSESEEDLRDMVKNESGSEEREVTYESTFKPPLKEEICYKACEIDGVIVVIEEAE